MIKKSAERQKIQYKEKLLCSFGDFLSEYYHTLLDLQALYFLLNNEKQLTSAESSQLFMGICPKH